MASLRVQTLLWGLLLTLSGGFAQGDPLQEMRTLLSEGSYHYAAQVVGPNLVEAHPTSPEAHFLYSYALYLTGDVGTAQSQLDEAARLEGTGADYDQLQGLLRAAQGDLEGAQRSLENAFSRGRSYEMAMDWGQVAWQGGDYDTALRAYEAAAATEAGKREPWPHLNRGRILLLEGAYDAATAAFEAAITVFEENDTSPEGLPSPAYVEAYYRLGEIYELRGDLEKAEQHYEFARVVDPNYTPTLVALERIRGQADP